MMRVDGVKGSAIGVSRGAKFSERLNGIRRQYLCEGLVSPEVDSPWIALKCAYGREMALADDAGTFGVECVIPSRLGRERRVRHRIIPARREPVMTGYAFVHIRVDAVSINAVLGLHHAIEVIGGAEAPALISSRQMFDFIFEAESGRYDWHHVVDERFARDELVKINAGLYAMQRARVVSIRSDGQGDAVVAINMLGKEHAVTMPIAFLEKL